MALQLFAEDSDLQLDIAEILLLLDNFFDSTGLSKAAAESLLALSYFVLSVVAVLSCAPGCIQPRQINPIAKELMKVIL
ncbi:MAG: hypothetical protein AAF310_01475 [Myxococcota bacterium]